MADFQKRLRAEKEKQPRKLFHFDLPDDDQAAILYFSCCTTCVLIERSAQRPKAVANVLQFHKSTRQTGLGL